MTYNVKVSPAGAVTEVSPNQAAAQAPAPAASGGEIVKAPLSGNIHTLKVSVGQTVNAGDVIMILEAMKMETEVRTSSAGTVAQILVKEGDTVQVGTPLLSLS